MPRTCSSKPGIKLPLPITSGYASPLPPSNATPSLKPSKSITAVSPFSTLPSSFTTRSAKRSCRRVISSSTSASLTSTASFVISRPLYAPSFTSGFTVTLNLNVTLSSSMLSISSAGREITHKSCSLIPALNASPATSSIASINIF